jgi:spermidine synthase
MVQQSESPLLHTGGIIRNIHLDLKTAGFGRVHTMPFPQPVYPSGWWCATMARKTEGFDMFRCAAAAERGFDTDYYNVGMHQAALATPEFMRRVLE